MEAAVEAMKPIRPREAKTASERARLFWQWAFDEIKKGIIAKNALNNISIQIGREEIIDVDHSLCSESVSSFKTDESQGMSDHLSPKDGTPKFNNHNKTFRR